MKIDANIPIPKIVQVARESKYPLRSLQIGDSFFIPKGNEKGTRNSISSLMDACSKRHGLKFVTRTVVEDNVKGLRVWRVA
jgi:hypothetical protein